MKVTGLHQQAPISQSFIRAFTLIELLIVVALIGILSSVSYGIYTNYVKDSYRTDAQATLLQMQQAMERFYTENNTYMGTHSGGTPNADFFPSTVPLGSSQPKYNLSLSTTATTYTLTATPVATAIMKDDGALTITHTNVKTFNGNNGWEKIN